jgi:hypothetical protein
MEETQTDDIPKVPPEKNNLLTTLYSRDEVKKTVFQMEHNKAPDQGSFPAEFCLNLLDVIKSDLLEMFSFFRTRKLELSCLTFCEIILLPKVNKADMIQ